MINLRFIFLGFFILIGFCGKAQQLTLVSVNKSIFKTNDTLVLRGLNLYQIELKSVDNQNTLYLSKQDWVSVLYSHYEISDSLYSFIIPANLQNVVYKIRGINTMTNDTTTNTFLIRINNINYDSIGVIGWGSNYYGQSDIPNGVNEIVQLEAGQNHSLALKSDGSVVA
ncbi:MAG: hypothetical protein ORN58_05100 [Sediminibacterium sp.]|nr:hypothetical protein [Sediminibacterium sp.]